MSDSTPATQCTIPQPGPSAEHESSCGLLGVAALPRPDAHALMLTRRLTIHCGRVTGHPEVRRTTGCRRACHRSILNRPLRPKSRKG
jgi:hypothetical protein